MNRVGKVILKKSFNNFRNPGMNLQTMIILTEHLTKTFNRGIAVKGSIEKKKTNRLKTKAFR